MGISFLQIRAVDSSGDLKNRYLWSDEGDERRDEKMNITYIEFKALRGFLFIILKCIISCPAGLNIQVSS